MTETETPPAPNSDSPEHETAEPTSIYAKGLVKEYGKRRVVDGVDVSVKAGEIVGLLGKNGAGKTTTFYMMVGLVAATQGSVFMDKEPMTNLPMHRRARMGLGYLPQEASVFRKLTVEQNLRAVAETLNLSKDERESAIQAGLKDLGLEHLSKQYAYTLSGGERRRLEISRALITRPRFLLMDEPFSGVDPISVSEVQDIVVSLSKKGIGILITDHNVRETLRIVDRAYLLHEGKVLTQGDRDFLVNDPKAREVYLGKDFSV